MVLLTNISPCQVVLGADLTFLSTFPHEKEYLYPPLTLLKPLSHFEVEVRGGSESQTPDGVTHRIQVVIVSPMLHH